jgi:hypothetical protein
MADQLRAMKVHKRGGWSLRYAARGGPMVPLPKDVHYGQNAKHRTGLYHPTREHVDVAGENHDRERARHVFEQLASPDPNGYPGRYERGSLIEGLDSAAAVEGVKIFHAGTKADGVRILADGGRVLNVSALGKSMCQARSRAYEAIARIHWPDGFCRRDIRLARGGKRSPMTRPQALASRPPPDRHWNSSELSTGPSPDLQRMKLLLPSSLCRRYRGRCFLGAIKPASELDPGFLEHLRPSPRATLGPGARILEFLFYGTPRRRRNTRGRWKMELLHRRCCGLDVHKETVVACLRLVSDGKVTTEVRTFQTTTADLLRLSEWLAVNGCTHVAMEATGIYWKPVWHILDDGEFELVLANAAHVKNVPGRKTDVNDAMWLAELLAHGLIRASFVPNAQTQEMRNLLRTRKQLVREQASHVQRVQKTLEDANIKLDSALTDVMGKSGRAMIEALIAGETNPTKLARETA